MEGIDPKNVGFYNDLNQLQELKSKTNRNDPEALKKVAKDFEQIFLSMMLKSMRDANESFGKDNFLNSSQVKFFEEMRDQQLTLEMAHKDSIGLADVLVKQLSGTLSKVKEASVAPDVGVLKDIEPGSSRLERRVPAFQRSASLSEFIDSAQQQRLFGEQLGAAGLDSASLPERFESPEQFVNALTPLAERAAAELGVEPKVLVAQAALETGWGKHISQSDSGRSSFNLFNIKADQRWSGDRLSVDTTEYRDGRFVPETAAFRQYDSYQQSFDDYVAFLKGSPRYKDALAQADDSQRYLQALQDAGYATDPKYAEKIYEISQRPLMLATLDTQVR